MNVYFFPFNIKTSGSCNNINNPYAKLCVSDVVKNLNVRAFNLMSRINETKHIEWHDTCKCKCRLDGCVRNNKESWNKNKCRCECKELIAKGICDKRSIWDPSNCESECDKSCDIGEYLDFENCKCRRKLVDQLIEECTKNIEQAKLAKITLAKMKISIKMNAVLAHCTVLFSIIFTINIGIGALFLLVLKKTYYSC